MRRLGWRRLEWRWRRPCSRLHWEREGGGSLLHGRRPLTLVWRTAIGDVLQRGEELVARHVAGPLPVGDEGPGDGVNARHGMGNWRAGRRRHTPILVVTQVLSAAVRRAGSWGRRVPCWARTNFWLGRERDSLGGSAAVANAV